MSTRGDAVVQYRVYHQLSPITATAAAAAAAVAVAVAPPRLSMRASSEL